MVRIEWNERALEDLGEIREYISRDSKNYALTKILLSMDMDIFALIATERFLEMNIKKLKII